MSVSVSVESARGSSAASKRVGFELLDVFEGVAAHTKIGNTQKRVTDSKLYSKTSAGSARMKPALGSLSMGEVGPVGLGGDHSLSSIGIV